MLHSTARSKHQVEFDARYKTADFAWLVHRFSNLRVTAALVFVRVDSHLTNFFRQEDQ
jgi:hypothetical protein